MLQISFQGSNDYLIAANPMMEFAWIQSQEKVKQQIGDQISNLLFSKFGRVRIFPALKEWIHE